MIGLMHEATPVGHLLLNGKAIDGSMLSRLIAVDGRTVSAALKELESVGVFSRTDDGVIISRRMIRDAQAREKAETFGRSGGRKSADVRGISKNQDQQFQQLNHQALEGEPEPHMPEAISQTPDKQERPLASLAVPGSDLRLFSDSDSVTHALPVAKPKAKRVNVKHQLPDDWRLSKAEGEFAIAKGFDRPRILQMAEAFALHHRAKGNTMKKWSLAWQTWVLNQIKFDKQRGGGTGRKRDTFASVLTEIYEAESQQSQPTGETESDEPASDYSGALSRYSGPDDDEAHLVIDNE